MSVELVNEITGRDGSQDVDTNKKYRRTFIVRTSTPQDGASVVLTAPGLPLFNDPYQYLDDSDPLDPVPVTDTAVVAVDIQVTQDNANDPQDWRVIVQYAGVEDPTSQPPDVDYSPVRYQKSLVVDLNDDPVVNSATDPFEGGITVDRTRFTLTITKAVDTFDPVAALAYQETLNQFSFLVAAHPPGFDPGTCKLTLSAKRIRRKGTFSFYWMRTAVIDIDREGWTVKVRDAGYNELVGGAKRIILISGGIQASSPQLLKPDGTKLPTGDPIPNPLEFEGYETKDWTSLALEYSL
jgi:hypothetical protein